MTDDIVIGGDSVDIPPGTYPAVLSGVQTKHGIKFDNDFRAWTFTLDSGSVVGGSSSMATGSKSKGGQWIAALLGRKPSQGEKVGSQIIGKPCLVVVVIDDDGWPKVDAVLPPMTNPAASTDAPSVSAATIPPVAAGDLPF